MHTTVHTRRRFKPCNLPVPGSGGRPMRGPVGLDVSDTKMFLTPIAPPSRRTFRGIGAAVEAERVRQGRRESPTARERLAPHPRDRTGARSIPADAEFPPPRSVVGGHPFWRLRCPVPQPPGGHPPSDASGVPGWTEALPEGRAWIRSDRPQRRRTVRDAPTVRNAPYAQLRRRSHVSVTAYVSVTVAPPGENASTERQLTLPPAVDVPGFRGDAAPMVRLDRRSMSAPVGTIGRALCLAFLCPGFLCSGPGFPASCTRSHPRLRALARD
jgi:hypothetical protein